VGGPRAVELGVGLYGRTAEQHSKDSHKGGTRNVELGGGFGGASGPDPVAAGRKGSLAQAEAMGLQGDEQCPGCTRRDGSWEACSVYKDGVAGRGSDGKKGRRVEGVWHCGKHGIRLVRIRRRAARAQ
jgi:hypothetical protein